jgi:hypothetical protein
VALVDRDREIVIEGAERHFSYTLPDDYTADLEDNGEHIHLTDVTGAGSTFLLAVFPLENHSQRVFVVGDFIGGQMLNDLDRPYSHIPQLNEHASLKRRWQETFDETESCDALRKELRAQGADWRTVFREMRARL